MPPNTSPKTFQLKLFIDSKKSLMFLTTMEVEMSLLKSWSIPLKLLICKIKPHRSSLLSSLLDIKEILILEPSLTSLDLMKTPPHRQLFNLYMKSSTQLEKECLMLMISRESLLQSDNTSQLLRSIKLLNMLTEIEMEVLLLTNSSQPSLRSTPKFDLFPRIIISCYLLKIL
jgi:hypothetical protein